MTGLAGGSLSQVAWTRDGALLAGGAHWADAAGSPIFRWAQVGRSKRAMLAAADGTVTGIIPLGDGGFVYVAADPAFGRYSAGLARVLDRRSDIADFRGQLGGLRFSADGRRLPSDSKRAAASRPGSMWMHDDWPWKVRPAS